MSAVHAMNAFLDWTLPAWPVPALNPIISKAASINFKKLRCSAAILSEYCADSWIENVCTTFEGRLEFSAATYNLELF
jgi:hypothetical protein